MFNDRSSRALQSSRGSTRRDPACGKAPTPWLLIPRRPAPTHGRGVVSRGWPLRREPDDV